jgi:hypothetical protein
MDHLIKEAMEIRLSSQKLIGKEISISVCPGTL